MADANKKIYSLHKSRHILKWVYGWYTKKSYKLNPSQLSALEDEMAKLDDALLKEDKVRASQIAHSLENFANVNCKKTFFEYTRELAVALVLALAIAVIIRMVWFEPYEIPTGSMRPTFREQDHLLVTKTAFGINLPFATDHIYFDPDLVQRSSVVIFSGDKLPLSDTDSTYFGLFPYKKRYIKRLLGKPGDSFYFYGGRLYGVDKDGNDLTELREAPWMQNLEYIPFLSFEGAPVQTSNDTVVLRQMHAQSGKLLFSPLGQLLGEVYNGKEWVKDQPLAQTKPHDTIETYSDLLGIRNYAEARLLTKKELEKFPDDAKEIPEGVLYLQLHHTPSLTYPKVVTGRGIGIGIPGYSAVIPLQQHHLDAIMDNLYTARFIVKNGKTRRYALGENGGPYDGPSLENVADGTYEFYFGKATQIKWGGIPFEVPKNNSIYSHDPDNIQKLFNMGIEMSMAFAPTPNNKTLFPHRYAYFRDGDLYLMGALIVKKDDPVLVAFHAQEKKKQEEASAKAPYVAFKDYGPPMKEGKIDAKFIRTFGVTLPEKQYLVLGDNHAMSADSRVFGFVPEENLQGAPCWIIWPLGDRLGAPPQKPYPFMNLPRAIIWTIAALIAAIWYAYHRRNLRRPIFVKKSNVK